MRRQLSIRQQGFSLVELMIATVIGLLMITAVLSAFVASSQSYRLQDAMSQVQETGRYVLAQVAFDFRNAGFGLDPTAAAVEGYVDAVAASADLNNQLLANINQISGPVIHIRSHDAGGDIAYYVANTGVGGDSLFRFGADLHPNPQALVEGVRDVAVEYGLDTNGDSVVDQFLGVAAVNNNWQQVVALRLAFLIASSEVVLDSVQNLPAPFINANANDRRLYQVFTTTIGLRNKMI